MSKKKSKRTWCPTHNTTIVPCPYCPVRAAENREPPDREEEGPATEGVAGGDGPSALENEYTVPPTDAEPGDGTGDLG